MMLQKHFGYLESNGPVDSRGGRGWETIVSFEVHEAHSRVGTDLSKF